MDFTFILQVRTGSSRLPRKMLLPFYKQKTIPEVLIDCLGVHFPEYPIIIATTDNYLDDELVALLARYPVKIFRGNENNVVKRFIDAGRDSKIDRFIRICADNPFLDMKLLAEMLNQYTSELDYLSYKIGDLPAMKTAYGFFAEISRMCVLERVLHLTKDPAYLEHVTNFIYDNPSFFRVGFLKANVLITANSNVRFTVDTQNDFDIAQQTYSELSLKKPEFNFEDLILWANENNLLKQMSMETSKNKK